MWEGEDHMEVVAVEQFGKLFFYPALSIQPLTLGATAVVTGVVLHALNVTVGTALNVTTHNSGLAAHNRLRGAITPSRQLMPPSEVGIVG
jgi:hypothetical protein